MENAKDEKKYQFAKKVIDSLGELTYGEADQVISIVNRSLLEAQSGTPVATSLALKTAEYLAQPLPALPGQPQSGS